MFWRTLSFGNGDPVPHASVRVNVTIMVESEAVSPTIASWCLRSWRVLRRNHWKLFAASLLEYSFLVLIHSLLNQFRQVSWLLQLTVYCATIAPFLAGWCWFHLKLIRGEQTEIVDLAPRFSRWKTATSTLLALFFLPSIPLLIPPAVGIVFILLYSLLDWAGLVRGAVAVMFKRMAAPLAGFFGFFADRGLLPVATILYIFLIPKYCFSLFAISDKSLTSYSALRFSGKITYGFLWRLLAGFAVATAPVWLIFLTGLQRLGCQIRCYDLSGNNLRIGLIGLPVVLIAGSWFPLMWAAAYESLIGKVGKTP